MKQMQKNLRIVGIGVLILALAGGLLLGGLRLYQSIRFGGAIVTGDHLAEHYSEEQADAILVLGCGVWDDGTLSPMLVDRLKRTIECYETHSAKKVLVSGDHQDYYDEVDHMAEYLIAHGVPDEDILRDYYGYSTYESMYRAAEVYNLERVIVVTQEYHLYRALMIGDAWGMDVIGVGADYRRYVGELYRNAREWVAGAKDFWNCVTKKRV